MSSPLLSVVIPTYNCAHLLGRALDSLLAQTYQNIEIVVVNDGSTDNTGELVQQRYPQVTYTEQENAGPCAARNAGIGAASGEFIGLLDSDDEWAPEKAQHQLQVLREHPEIDILGTNGWRVAGSQRYLAHNPAPQLLWQSSVADIFGDRHPMANSIVLPRRILVEVGGYDMTQQFFEDLDLLCSMMYRGYTLYCLDEPLYIHHRRPASRSTRSQTRGILEGRLRTLAKLDPGNDPKDTAQLFGRRQHSLLTAYQIAQATNLILLAGEKEALARETIAGLDALPALPPGLRLLSRLRRLNWPLFARLFPQYQRMVYLGRLIKAWGLLGSIRRQRALKRMEAELSVGGS